MSINLEKSHCSVNSEVQSITHHDCTIDGITYRVWSAFLGRKNAEDSLRDLMLRKLESYDEELVGDTKQNESKTSKKRKTFFVKSNENS